MWEYVFMACGVLVVTAHCLVIYMICKRIIYLENLILEIKFDRINCKSIEGLIKSASKKSPMTQEQKANLSAKAKERWRIKKAQVKEPLEPLKD